MGQFRKYPFASQFKTLAGYSADTLASQGHQCHLIILGRDPERLPGCQDYQLKPQVLPAGRLRRDVQGDGCVRDWSD
jgi:hypothetical protein